jgi:hypothetical protein
MDLLHFSRVNLRTCEPSRFCTLFRRSSTVFNFLYGLQSGIPLCCVLEFCFRACLLNQPSFSPRVCGWALFFCPWLNHFPCYWHRRRFAAWFYPSGILSDAVWIPKECMERG